MNQAFDNLRDALERLRDAIYDAFTVRIWGDRVALWQVLIAVELLGWIVLTVVKLIGYVR